MKIAKSLMFLMMIALLFGACDQDPVAVNENNVPNGIIQQKYVYTVHVVASTERGRTAGLKNATVTLSQKANVKSVKVNESGEAVFTDLSAGALTYFIKAEGFASVNGEDNLQPTPDELTLINAGNDGKHVIELSRSPIGGVIELPSLAASLKGVLLGDLDRNPQTADAPAAGFKVRLRYDSYIQPNLYFATVAADGSFEFKNVPEASASVIIDTVLTIAGQHYSFYINNGYGVEVGGTTTGVLTLGTSGNSVISFTGTFRFKPWANFDFLTPNPIGSFQATSEVTAATVIFTIDYSSDSDFPTDLNPIFTGTRDANGVWTFANLPVDYTGVLKYSFTKTYDEDASGCLIIPAAGFTFNASGTYACSTSANPVAYTRTVTWNGFAVSNSVYIGAPNETVDKGAFKLAE